MMVVMMVMVVMMISDGDSGDDDSGDDDDGDDDDNEKNLKAPATFVCTLPFVPLLLVPNCIPFTQTYVIIHEKKKLMKFYKRNIHWRHS